MDELIVRALQGHASPAEEERLAMWRRQATENEQHYRELSALWMATAAALPSQPVSEHPTADAVIARAQVPALSSPLASHSVSQRPARTSLSVRADQSRFKLRAAVLAAACIVAGFGLATVANLATSAEPLLAHGEITTGAGEMTTISLGDGSSIRLGPRSRIRLSMEGETRVAYLEGRAFFGVQSDGSRRFIVRTRFGEAVVLGTRFEVRSNAEEFRVLVVEGRVRVKAAGSAAELEPGQMSRSPHGGQLISSRVDDVFAHLDWMGNALVFQATSLPEVIQEIEHRYGMPVALADPDLAEMTITATFTDQPLQDVVRVVCETLQAQCVITNKSVTIGSTALGK